MPTLAIIVKKTPQGMRRYDPRNLIKDTYCLVLLCSYTLQPVACGPDGSGYEFSKLKPGMASFLEKVSPLVTLSLIVLKTAVTMYGIPLPLPNLVNFSKEDSLAYLSDTMKSLSDQYQCLPILSQLEESINRGLSLNEDITNQMNLSTQRHRDAHDALQSFFSSYHPPNYGLRKCTSPSGITMWIKDDDNVEESFHKNDGKRMIPIK